MTTRLCLALAAGVAAATLGVPATGADASGWRRLAPSTIAFSSDGARYVIWQVSKGAPIVVFDTGTGHRGQFARPGCEPFDEGRSPEDGLRAADGRFLVFCGNSEGLLDVGTGLVTILPTAKPGAGAGEYGPSWQVVGSDYIEGWDDKHKCRQTAYEIRHEEGCVALYDIATGAVSVRPHSGLADLDRRGAPPVCPRLRAKISEEVSGYVTDERVGYSKGVFAEGTVPVRISRCRGRRMLLNASGEPRDVQLSAGLLTWDTGHPLSDFEGELSNPGFRHGALESYELSSGHRRSLTLPALALRTGEQEHPVVDDVIGYSTHTANTVVWIATRALLFGEAGASAGPAAVYAARL